MNAACLFVLSSQPALVAALALPLLGGVILRIAAGALTHRLGGPRGRTPEGT